MKQLNIVASFIYTSIQEKFAEAGNKNKAT